MSNYRRALAPGRTWFFTVNLLERHSNDLLVHGIDLLRQVVKHVRHSYPFHIDAWAGLPEQIWEHLIRDEQDFQRYVDYVHVNPLKHGLVQQDCDWPYSTFHRYADAGIYSIDWCGDATVDVVRGD